MSYAYTPSHQQPSAPASAAASPGLAAGGSEPGIGPAAARTTSTASSVAQAYPGTRPPLLLRPAPDSNRRLSHSSFDTSAGSEFSLGPGTGDDGNLGGGGGRHGKAVRFGDGAKANRTATQSMADFLRNVPPPPEVQSPTRSTSSVQDKIRKPVRLFGRNWSSSKSDDVGKTSVDRSAERTPPLAQESTSSRGQAKGLQQVITPSGQTVHLIPYRPSPSGGNSAPQSSFAAPSPAGSAHHPSSSFSSETSTVPSEASSGPPVLPELHAFSDEEEGAGADRPRQPRPFPLGERGRLHSSTASAPLVSDVPPPASQPARGLSESASMFLAPPSHDSPQIRRTLSRSTSSPNIFDTVPQIVLPSTSSTKNDGESPSAESFRPAKAALRVREAATLEMLGQRIERDDQGELVLGRRVSKRTVSAQTNISAVRSLLEMSRERPSTGKSTRSAESTTAVPPSPAVLRATGRLALSVSPSTEGSGRRRNASIDPDSSIVGGESDDDEPLPRSATSATGTFGPSRSSTQSMAPSISSATPSSPAPPLPAQPPPPRPTPPPLVPSESRGSVSSTASASSWSVYTPSLAAVPATAAFGSLSPAHDNMRKSPSGSRLRPSNAPTGAAGSGAVEAREREQLEAKVRAAEERLALETEKRREAERKLRRLQASTHEGRARWEDMAAWAVEVIEASEKDRHLLGLENARLQRTINLYRNQFGDVELLPADQASFDGVATQPY